MFGNILSEIPYILLSLPIVLLSLSIHEASHAYVSYKLGDDTAYINGRVTLNPMKHIDIIGFICMLFFGFGWAKPVPINSRKFNNPRKGMAISAAAGPISNLALGVIFMVLLRLFALIFEYPLADDFFGLMTSIVPYTAEIEFEPGTAFKFCSVIVYMLYTGVILNFSLALFNLIPIPPLDGSRIAYIFMPPKWYFGIMKYERIIMIVMFVLLWTDIITVPLSFVVSKMYSGLAFLFSGFNYVFYNRITYILYYVSSGLFG